MNSAIAIRAVYKMFSLTTFDIMYVHVNRRYMNLFDSAVELSEEN